MTNAYDPNHDAGLAEVVELPRLEPVPDMAVPILGPARITSPMEPLLGARRTSEHYVQAQKVPGTEHEEEIRNASGPGEAARMGRQRSRPLRPDWEQVKDDIMREVVLAKFTQHDDLRRALLDTGDAELIEHTANDAYWADGGDGSGKNMLGKILMEVREQLRR